MKNFEDKTVIFFDGVCNLCNTSVQFILKHDHENVFLFSSLQSDAAQTILLQNKLENLNFGSILLYDKGEIYDKSSAILKITRRLSGAYKLLYIFIVVPKFIRDAGYKYVAKNRYKWFGKRENCMIPSDAIQQRFIA